MDRDTARQEIRQRISCKDYLTKSKSGMYCCPICGSGTGKNQTGALKLYDTNTWYCHACKTNGDVLDLIRQKYGTDYNGALKIAADQLGITIDPYRQENAGYDINNLELNDLKTLYKTSAQEKDKERQAARDKEAAAALEQYRKEQQEAARSAPDQTEDDAYNAQMERDEIICNAINRAFIYWHNGQELPGMLKKFLCNNTDYEYADSIQEFYRDYGLLNKDGAISEYGQATIEAEKDMLQATQNAAEPAEDKEPAESIKPPENAVEDAERRQKYFYMCARNLWNENKNREISPAVAYLEGRGLYNAVNSVDVGYDPKADPAKAPFALEGEPLEHPRPRIIVRCGNSYIGRAIEPNIPRIYRVMNPKGYEIELFNAHILKVCDEIIVTEGVFDALSFIECGFNAIALNGKGNGKKLIKEIKRLKDHESMRFIICPDNDKNPETDADTKKRAEELKQNLQAAGCESIVYNIAGDYHDANDALIGDRAGFEQRTNEAIQTLQAAIKEKAEREKQELETAANGETPDTLTAFLEKIQTEAYKPYKTELSFFDDLLAGGVIRQSILLLMAAPGTGKTTLCQQIAECMAEHGKPVLYLNFEMSAEQMLSKALSNRLSNAGHPASALNILQGYEWDDTRRAAVLQAVADYREKIYPYLSYNPDGVGAELTKLKEYLQKIGEDAKVAGKEAPVVILDYLHLITAPGVDLQEMIKQAITTLKGYAVKFDTFCIAISATNRISNMGGKITLESGRDSSNLEYTGDYVLSLNYYDIDNGTVKAGDVEAVAQLQREKYRRMIIRVLKGRFVPPGKSAKVYFHAERNTFYGENDTLPDYDGWTPFDEENYDINNLTLPENKKNGKKNGNEQHITASF